jgi:uncharacterized protein YcsI (UPF0317 family)
VGIKDLETQDHGLKNSHFDPPIMGMRPSHYFDPRTVGIKDLDPQDHGIKSGLRDTLIPQCWGSKLSDPAVVAFASF